MQFPTFFAHKKPPSQRTAAKFCLFNYSRVEKCLMVRTI